MKTIIKRTGLLLALVALGLVMGPLAARATGGEPASEVLQGVTPGQDPPGMETEEKPAERRPSLKPTPSPSVRRVGPATPSPRPKPGPGDKPEIYKQLLRSTVLIIGVRPNGDMPCGTGWIVDKQKGLVVTNDHVVDETKSLGVFFPAYKDGKLITDQQYYLRDAKPIRGTLIDSDAKCDLALVRLERMPDEAVPLKLASQSAAPGETVHSVGNPLTTSGTVWIYTTGNVRQVHRLQDSPSKHGSAFDARVVSTQSPVNHGDSGGPVVNDRMELVAVVSRGRSDANLMQFFIDVDEVRAYLRTTGRLVEPKTAKDFNLRGIRHYRQDRFDEAAHDFAEALKLDPRFLAAMANRGSAFLEKGDFDTALADLNAAIQSGGQEDWMFKARGRVYQAKGKYQEAIADFTEALRRKPDSALLYNYRGMANGYLKRHAEAVADYTRALEREPMQAVFYNRGVALTKLGRHQEAVADFTAALRTAPKNARYYDWRGYNHFKLKHYEEALKDFTVAIRLDGENALYHNERGDLLYEIGEFKLALQDYHAAVNLNPQKALYYFNRGMALLKLGVTDAAAADFVKAVQLDPKFKPRIPRVQAKPAKSGQ